MIMVLSINLACGLHNKIELLSLRCAICWMLPVLSSFTCMFPSRIGVMRISQPIILWIVCLPLSWVVKFPIMCCFPTAPYPLSHRVYSCTCYVHALDPGMTSSTLERLSVFFLGTLVPKKVTSVTLPLFCVILCEDFTLNKSLSYFPSDSTSRDPGHYLPTHVPSMSQFLPCQVPQWSHCRFMFAAEKWQLL